MNYLGDQNYLNRRAKIWQEYAPFYLDYADTLQCGFSVSFVEWIGKKKEGDKWDRYRLLCVGSANTGSSFELVDVLYPTYKAMYRPEELVNTNGGLSSVCEQQAGAPEKR